MATLAADKPRIFETGHDEYLNELPMIASDIIYEGAAVGELNDTGTYQPLGTGSTVDRFAGFCTEKCDNSAGAAGDKKVKVKQKGRVILAVTGATAITDKEKIVWATDDNVFTLTYAAGAVMIGHVSRWIGTADGGASTTCVVEFKAFELRESVEYTFADETVSLATDRAIFLATRPYDVRAVDCVFSVAAGGAVGTPGDEGRDHRRPRRRHGHALQQHQRRLQPELDGQHRPERHAQDDRRTAQAQRRRPPVDRLRPRDPVHRRPEDRRAAQAPVTHD
jgi:hypothetical protein